MSIKDFYMTSPMDSSLIEMGANWSMKPITTQKNSVWMFRRDCILTFDLDILSPKHADEIFQSAHELGWRGGNHQEVITQLEKIVSWL